MAARLGRDLPPFLRTPLRLEEARARVRWRLANRDRSFLSLVDRAVYGHARSPYRRLLAHAGCERGDLEALVAREGLEGALAILAARGVYVSFDEFKGRRPAVRGSAHFAFSDRDFDNPLHGVHLVVYTGGSGGRPTPVRRSLRFLAEGTQSFGLVAEAHGIRRSRIVFWFGASPFWGLVQLKLGNPVDAWFSPAERLPWLPAIGLRYVTLLARLADRRLPFPVYCDLQEPERLARWLTRGPAADRPVLVNTSASSAVRIAGAAARMSRTLDGVTFHCRMEPLTDARRRLIEESGARAMPEYGSNELAFLSFGCPTGVASDDLHLCSDLYAATERQRAVHDGGPTVGALLLTTLSDATPKIAINAELGDSARIEERDCGCLLGELGLRTHLSEIRSFEKLSSEGTTFIRSDVMRILEEQLPARFGGTAPDYQLVEEETADGATVLALHVHPDVGALDAEAVRAALLQELGRGDMLDRYQARLVERAESIVVRREPPLATAAGKVLPFHLARGVRRADPVAAHAAGPRAAGR
jgi:hypothetical protein